MLDEDFKLKASAALSRIEQKVDNVLHRVGVLEEHDYDMNRTKLSTGTLLGIMAIIATVIAGCMPALAHLFK